MAAARDQGSATVAFRRPNPRGGWIALVLATLMTFLAQGFVTQTHLHLASAARLRALAALSGTAATLETGPSSPDQPTCPICQEVAHAGSYLAPTPVTFTLPAPDARWRVVMPAPGLAPRQDSHAWRSRAPPQHLHA